ncbi:MAG TPA: GWxTD domain-containing protein [Terriglobales bacterium]|nr:GWxTD domain-containing protein [Terriglobales bacterium]
MAVDRFRTFFVVLLLTLWSFAGAPVWGQNDAKPAGPSTSGQDAAREEADPLKRPLTEKQRKEQEKSLKRELGKTYKRWLDEDVRWIIMDEELQAFKQFSNDEERDQFIEQFWLRRDPTPDTVENEYKEEHYRRMAYANERFAAGKPGWKTDRGRIYIIFGPPDQIDAHPSGGMYQRPMEEGGGSTSTFPFEVWRYRYLDLPGAGQQEVEIEFVDTCMCGDYHMTIDRSEKDALLYVPNAGPTWFEEMGLANKADRFTGGGLERLGVGPFNRNLPTSQFDRLELYGKLQKPPQIKFKELEEVVTSKVRYNLMPFDVRVDFVRVTTDTVLVPVTIQLKNRDLTFVNKEGVQRGVANIFGRLTTLTGRIAQTFEDTVQVDVPEALLSKTIQNASVYWKAMPLRPGRYRLDIVVKDVNGDRVGTWSRGLLVPSYDEDKLAASTLIVADQMEKVPTRQVGSGNFVIGTTKVRPRVEPADGKPASFKRSANDRVNFWMQVYNLSVDEKTQKPSATIEYDLVNVASKQSLMKQVESTDQLGNVGEQVTLEKSLPIQNLPPGVYQLTIKVNDNLSKQTIAPTAKFAIE